jgi:hypothetical protein
MLAYLGVPTNPFTLLFHSPLLENSKMDNPKSIINKDPYEFLIIFCGLRS